MKTNFISKAAEILIFAATVIIVCLICVIAFKTTNEGKSAASSGTGQLNEMFSEHQDVNKSIYDGSTILGSELVNLINKTMEKKEYLAIVVITKANAEGVAYNYDFTPPAESGGVITPGSLSAATNANELQQDSKGDINYINTSAQFLGTVYKNANNNVICIEFIQQD